MYVDDTRTVVSIDSNFVYVHKNIFQCCGNLIFPVIKNSESVKVQNWKFLCIDIFIMVHL